MKNGIFIGAGLVAILLILACTTGLISVRTSDTHNTTIAVTSYNTWVSGQKDFNNSVQGAVVQIGDHVRIFNSEIAKDQPDYALLRSNLAEDRQLLDLWGAGLETFSPATDRFDKDTSSLTYQNASEKKVRESLGLMTGDMKAYTDEMGNARQHLIRYVDNAATYIRPDDPDYWNEKYRQQAMQEKDLARQSLAKGDSLLGNLTAQARILEQLQ